MSAPTREQLAEKRRRWLISSFPEWRLAVEQGTLSDAGVAAEVADRLLQILRAHLTAVPGEHEILRQNAPVISDHEQAYQRATPRHLAQAAALLKQKLSTIDGLALRDWVPEVVGVDGQVAHTVRVAVWCEAAATEVRGRLVLDRGEA